MAATADSHKISHIEQQQPRSSKFMVNVIRPIRFYRDPKPKLAALA
jgi:hypothetical protein